MKVLLIGSSFSAVPFLFDLKRRGASVTVIGKYESDPAHAYADASIYEDYSNPESLLRVCEAGEYDFIVPSCNDFSYVSGSYVADKIGFCGFDSPEVTEILHVKNRFRHFCGEVGLPVPRIYGEVTFEDIDQLQALSIDGPVLVKPVDSFSGRGVQRVVNSVDLPAAVDRAFSMSRSKGVVIEEFVEGALHSHTCFVSKGEIVWHEFVDEYCEVYPYQVDRSQYPSNVSSVIRSEVHQSIEKITSCLKLTDGLLHTQFISSGDKFWIVECMRRCPGDLYGHHFKLSFDYDYERNYVSGFVGKLPLPPEKISAYAKRIERRVMSSSDILAYMGVDIQSYGRRLFYVPLKDSGLKLEVAPFDKAGIAFLVDDYTDEAQKSPITNIWTHA